MSTSEFRTNIFASLKPLTSAGAGFWAVRLEAFTCPPEFTGVPMRVVSGVMSWLARSDNIRLLTGIMEDLTDLHRQKETPFSKIQLGRAGSLDVMGDDGIGFGYDFYRDSTTPLTGYDFFGDRNFIEGCRESIERGEPAEAWKKMVREKVADLNVMQKHLNYPPWREE